MQEDGADPGAAASSPGGQRATGTGTRASITGGQGTLKLPARPVATPVASAPKKPGDEQTSVVTASDSSGDMLKAEKPEERVVNEIVGCLKMRNSMLAMGACERVKKIARVYPVEVANSAIMDQLLGAIKDDPASPLSGSVMQALSIMALNPEGRQKICLMGGAAPLITFIRSADLSKANLDRAVTLLMNLAADTSNRRTIREDGAVEALTEVLKVAPMGEPVTEHALGALHNIALLDAKAKARALEAGVLHPLVRASTAKGLPDSDMCVVRARMILTELLKLPETEERLAEVAAELGVKL